MTTPGPVEGARLKIDYSRSDMERRMRLLEMASGDLRRAMELERWVQCGGFNQNEGVTSPGVNAGSRSEPSGPAEQSVNLSSPSERVSLGHLGMEQGQQSGISEKAKASIEAVLAARRFLRFSIGASPA